MSFNEMSPQQHIQWNHPRPLLASLEPEMQYPVDALPPMLRNAVTSYQHYGQQPMALVACSALANLSLACQALANVARDRYLVSPVSLYFLVVAQSGERKSAADNVFSKPTRSWEANIRKIREPDVQAALTRVLWKKRQKCSIWIKPSKNAVSTVFPINSQAQ